MQPKILVQIAEGLILPAKSVTLEQSVSTEEYINKPGMVTELPRLTIEFDDDAILELARFFANLGNFLGANLKPAKPKPGAKRLIEWES